MLATTGSVVTKVDRAAHKYDPDPWQMVVRHSLLIDMGGLK